MNEIKEVYNFIDEAYHVANEFFKFFYEKNISWLKYSNIEDEDRRRELFTEDGSSLKGREAEFESVFFNLAQKYKKSERTSDDYIYIVEQAMLQTDTTGRIAIARRLIRKLGELARIGAEGIDEVTGIDFCCSSSYWLECAYADELEIKDNKYKIPDNLIKTEEIVAFIFSIENTCLHFMEVFKELCRDFGIAYEEEVSAFGFDGLLDITRIEWDSKRKDAQEEKRCVGGNEFTMQRKRAAILYMLSELNSGIVYGRDGDVSGTEVQRFIYFLTGRGRRLDNINNTSVASAFKKDHRSGVKIEEDDDFIAEYFDKIGLNELAKKVRNGELSGII